MSATVGSAVHWWAKTDGERTAIVVDDESVTYRQLHDWSGRLAKRLNESGISPGDRVGLLAPNCLLWPVAALAVLKAGAILVPLNTRLRPAELGKVVDDAGITTVIAAAALTSGANEARTAEREFDLVQLDGIEAERSGEPEDFRVDGRPNDPISIIFTSGSTGLSKGVILTNQTLLNIALERTLTEDGFRPGSVCLLVLPLAFTPGLVYGLLLTTVLGGTLVVERELKPARAVTLIEKHSVQALFGVPLIFEAMARSEEFAAADLSSLETAIVGGAAVPTELLAAWAAKGVLLRQIYGMTESGGVATATLKPEALDHPGSCGIGSIFTDVRIQASDGSAAAPGELGEVVVRGPGVTPGYWGDPTSTASAIRDDWLHSGDLGTSDDFGRITFVDRMKDLIISGGINISPVELEATIGQLDGVEEVAVIAAKDARFGETPAAIITVAAVAAVAAGAEALDEAAVIAHCEVLLSDYKVPRYVVLRSEPLPRLPSGKLAKTVIREEYSDVAERFPRAR